jgi:hypothetical protein
MRAFFFTSATTLCASWPSPWFHNNKFFRCGVVSPTLNLEDQGLTLRLAYPLTCLAWVGLPGSYAPSSIALQVTGARKHPLDDEGYASHISGIFGVADPLTECCALVHNGDRLS